ncbi:isopenicillin-N N-acyltransferase [Sporothrix schenckii 1099-18]|uniref:Peptidase C45 hydrolase domain-containing protein n=2 Tax=Sporothrix schenckii TaxID=29908 RepID=U7PVH8_SPOS1|nr:isopenicillin-N N-acyltransferase [Sporothrix schenckii 1099-18]ERS99602.1 hypothetical protein HMPREF1624_02962 [Sporothrix schenckii ATCC 58251]KJR86056.1 isopenicillin-N N-acyltransferase [Sporothrix schenckii 1099-18]
MLEITCSGTPYEIGLQHGRQAVSLVHGSIDFYREYFERKSKLSWDASTAAAMHFQKVLDIHVPHLVEEMRGIADGAGVPYTSILAINARSEIAMGLMDDGCTSVAWTTDDFSVAGQNWDWEDPQRARLVLMHIRPAADPIHPRVNLDQVTEAGIVGKIGLNAHGVAVFLNALRAPGVNYDALPAHVALRVALEAPSRAQALAQLRAVAPAAGTSVHIMVADATGAMSIECTAVDMVTLSDVNGKLAHTNHFLAKHAPDAPTGASYAIFPDTYARQERITQLLDGDSRSHHEAINDSSSALSLVQKWLADTDGFPVSINRQSSPPGNGSTTLFSIAVDLHARRAIVIDGRPTNGGKTYYLDLSAHSST